MANKLPFARLLWKKRSRFTPSLAVLNAACIKNDKVMPKAHMLSQTADNGILKVTRSRRWCEQDAERQNKMPSRFLVAVKRKVPVYRLDKRIQRVDQR